jgi:kinesin family protein 6/9
MFDLLSDHPRDPSGGSAISIQDDSKGEVHVKGLSQCVVNNEEEALNHLFEGEQRKTTASTSMNENSSRSHSVYTVYVESKARAESTEKIIVSKLHLVDLAGNERTKKLEKASRMKEANYINKSLSFLEQVVVSSCDNKKDHVPYRQSKLTNLLKNAVGGNC